jgi:hypothetical protein
MVLFRKTGCWAHNEVKMRRRLLSLSWCLTRIGLVLPACLGTAPPAHADIPWLSVRLGGGEMANYPVDDLNRIGFEGDTVVVVHAGGTERYGAAAGKRLAGCGTAERELGWPG